MPKWNELKRFLGKKANGWECCKQSSHHDHYQKVLPNGEVLITRISRSSGEIPPPIWKRIKKQMRIDDESFGRDK
jgi:hypothetical protein